MVTFVLWNQELDVEKLQRRLGLREPIIEVFSNDPRLADLTTLDSPAPKRRVATALSQAQSEPGGSRTRSRAESQPCAVVASGHG